MSWSLKIAAKSKTGALNALSEKAKQPTGLPSAVAALIAATIEALPDGKLVLVESNGHLDASTGGNAAFTITPYIEVVD